MALKNTYESAQDIPEGMESLYTQSEDGSTFTMQEVEGLVDKGRLDEFRENNIQLRKDMESQQGVADTSAKEAETLRDEMKALQEKFSAIDMEEWNTLQADKKAMADKELIEAGEVDTLINRRVEEVLAAKQKEMDLLRSDYDTKVSTLETDLSEYDGQLSRMLVDNEITKFAAESGVRSSAIEDVLSRGRSLFRVDEGHAVAFDDAGRKVYGEDAVTPLTISGWLGNLTNSAPHLFEASTGAGAVQQVQQAAPVKQEPTETLDLLRAGLQNIGIE